MDRRTFPVAVCCVLLLILAAPGWSTPWTPEDVLTSQAAQQLTLSADGSVAVWVVRSAVKVDDQTKMVGQAWWARLGDDASSTSALQLTRDPAGVGAIGLSPDGRHLAFTTTRERPGVKAKGPQLWVLPLTGGEAFGLTAFDRPVADFAWIDNDTLLVARPESASTREKGFEEQKDTSVAVDDVRDAPPVRLWRVGLDGEAKRLTTNDDWIEEMAVAPGGRTAVVRAAQSLHYAFDSRIPPRTFSVDLTTGERTEILAESNFLPGEMQWADDQGFYFVDQFTNHPLYRMATVARLHHYDLASGATRRIDGDWPRGLGRGYEVVDGGVVALLADGARLRPARWTIDNSVTRHDLTGDHVRHIAHLTASRDGSRVLYQSSTPNRPPQVFTARLDGHRLVETIQLGELNPGWADKPTGRSEVIRWQGAEGDEVEGLLHYPLDWVEGQKAPLILDIHGGPAGVDLDLWSSTFNAPNILWRQRGAFVFQVNYHGSSAYGLEWVESIRERYYELEIPDIETGVDHLIAEGLVDADRLAVTGWSNGGILGAALVVETDRYKAAIIGAADVEWISDWANVDFGASFDHYYFGGPPWEHVETYIEKSPFFRLGKVTTPVLIHTGGADRAVPTHQSWSLFRALQYLDRAPVRFLLYPGEPHGLQQMPHRRRKLAEDLAWLDQYLFAVDATADDTIPEASPLAAWLDRAEASRVDGMLGVDDGGLLVPETVSATGGVELGRFEVTRAQWAAFRPTPGAATTEADYPVAGVSFEAAQAYVEWLGERTGENWRLPTVAEAEAWSGDGGNVLDRWLGQAPNPDDAERIRRRLQTSGATLLRPVGEVGGKPLTEGAARVFDLDGNVAEWALDGDGGRAVGPSAERATGSTVEPAAAYVGLRVVRVP